MQLQRHKGKISSPPQRNEEKREAGDPDGADEALVDMNKGDKSLLTRGIEITVNVHRKRKHHKYEERTG